MLSGILERGICFFLRLQCISMQPNRKKETLSLFTEIFKERAISMSRENKYKDTVCFKPLVTVYVKGFKDEDWIYIFVKTLSPLGIEVILLKQVSYRIHYKWVFNTVMKIGKPKQKEYTCTRSLSAVMFRNRVFWHDA